MKLHIMVILFCLIAGFQTSCQAQDPYKKHNLDKIQLPEGFHIELYAEVPNAREMALAEDGTIFVGSREMGKIYAVTKEKKVIILDSGLEMPAGLDYYKGDLYVSAVSKIIKYPGILKNLSGRQNPVVVYDKYPSDKWHGWKFIRFGPDGMLYVPVGAPCNVCVSADPVFASVTRINRDGSHMEIVAHGVRNTVGFDWDPQTGELWFTDNGRDNLGDNLPTDELNKLTRTGEHFGFPFVHGKDIRDPDFWEKHPVDFEWMKPESELGPHVAALGMRFYSGKMFPEKYRGGIFIAEHGSWNRTSKIGYRVVFISVKDGKAAGQEVFASGWLQGEKVWGRPADVMVMPDGSLLVSDDMGGKIFRIYFQ